MLDIKLDIKLDIGINEKKISIITTALSLHPKVTKAVIFGSRAKGNFEPYSDIDIAIYGDLNPIETEGILSDLDDLATAYSFDVVAYNHIKNPDLQDHIDRVGVVFYENEG